MPSPFTPEQISQILEAFFEAVGTRQYIGARYVPIFGRIGETSIQWDNTGTYEPLTIVLHNGNSYTSRQFVPAGVEITNESFWANTGNYNGQIEQYRQVAMQASEDATQALTDVGAVSSIIPAADFSESNTVKQYIDASVDGISTDVSDLILTLRALEDEVASIGSITGFPNCVLLGDSWTDIDSATVFDHTNWTTYLPYWTFHNYAVGGSGFLTGTNFATQAQNAADDDTFDHSMVTHCLVIGGINDWRADGGHSSSSYTTPLRQTITTLHDSFPNAKIYIIFASTTRPMLGAAEEWIDTWRMWNTLIRWLKINIQNYGIGLVNGFCITNMFPESAFITWGESNYQRHLSKLGHQQLALCINHIIETGETPTITMRASSALESDNTAVTMPRFFGVMHNSGFKLSGQLHLSAALENSTRVYFDLRTESQPDKFYTNPRQGIYNFVPQDLFPKRADESVSQNNSSYPIPNATLQKTVHCQPAWGSTFNNANGTLMCLAVLPYYANNPLRLVIDIKNAPAGDYNFDITVPFFQNSQDDLLCGATFTSEGVL